MPPDPTPTPVPTSPGPTPVPTSPGTAPVPASPAPTPVPTSPGPAPTPLPASSGPTPTPTPASGTQLADASSSADTDGGSSSVGDTSHSCSEDNPQAEIAVRVKTSDGTPVEGVSVSIAELGLSGTTGADGVYDFGEVAPGTYTATGQKDNYSPSGGTSSSPASQSQAAPAGASTLIDLVLDPICGDLVITVINDEDPSDVMSGFTVQISGPSSNSQSTDNTGHATFKCIPVGAYTYTQTNNCFVNPTPTPSTNVAASQTNTADLHIKSNHSTLKIKQLAFTGNNPVENDTTGVFAPPEWVDGRAQSAQLPVSYSRNKNIGVNATFTVTAGPTCTETVTVTGTATFGSVTLALTGSVTVNPGDAGNDLAPVSLTSNNPLADQIDVFDSTDITWTFQVASGGGVRNPGSQPTNSAGTTRNVIYVTLGDPAGSPSHWTLLDISCRAASGKNTENDFVSASYVPFTTHTGDGNGFKRMRDGAELTYYKFGSGTPSIGVFSCADLLSRADGTGRCGAWARFLVAMHQVHGVTSSAVLGVVPKFANLLIVKNCTFNGAGSLTPPFTHKGQTECVKSDGIFGQGKNNPQFTFGDHALVQHPTGIYDPSYGVGPSPDLKTWETGGIAGLGDSAIVSFSFGGDPHFMPAHCSVGFILYTAAAGDTLDSIATSFGVGSGSALYNHAYNWRLRAIHPPPGTVSTGDMVIIPRDIASIGILKPGP